MKRIASLLFLSAVMLLAAPAIHATPITYVTDLSGAAEAPPTPESFVKLLDSTVD